MGTRQLTGYCEQASDNSREHRHPQQADEDQEEAEGPTIRLLRLLLESQQSQLGQRTGELPADALRYAQGGPDVLAYTTSGSAPLMWRSLGCEALRPCKVFLSRKPCWLIPALQERSDHLETGSLKMCS